MVRGRGRICSHLCVEPEVDHDIYSYLLIGTWSGWILGWPPRSRQIVLLCLNATRTPHPTGDSALPLDLSFLSEFGRYALRHHHQHAEMNSSCPERSLPKAKVSGRSNGEHCMHVERLLHRSTPRSIPVPGTLTAPCIASASSFPRLAISWHVESFIS